MQDSGEIANRSSRQVPGPSWDAANVRQRLRDQGYELDGELPPVAWFGDDPDQATQLAELVRQGAKRATAGLLWRWQEQGGPPQPGDRQIVIDWQGEPRAVIEMTDVRTLPFNEVDAEFAREEGEGDLSLDYWRQVHWDFFGRECERLGRTPGPTMPVVCMRFRLVDPTSS
jgi:uncharacterized protein YhfF